MLDKMRNGGGSDASLLLLAVLGVIGLVAVSGVIVMGMDDAEAAEPGQVGYQFTVGDVTYEVIADGEVEVADASPRTTGEVSIPSVILDGSTSYSVTSIGDYAFVDCISLTTVTIPDSVTVLGEGAFAGSSIESVIIPSGINDWRAAVFQSCSNLTSVILTDGIETIGNNAFARCSLDSITIPDSVEYIGFYAFWGTPLETVIFESDDCPELSRYSFATNTELMVYTPGWDPVEPMSSAISDEGFGLYEDTVVVWANDPSKAPDLTFLSTPSSGILIYIGRSAA